MKATPALKTLWNIEEKFPAHVGSATGAFLLEKSFDASPTQGQVIIARSSGKARIVRKRGLRTLLIENAGKTKVSHYVLDTGMHVLIREGEKVNVGCPI